MKHIYIIEDDIGILEGLTFLLEKTYRVTAMCDARIALDQLTLEQPDLILLDLFMPELNGSAFLEALLERSLKIPVLVMSAAQNEQLNYPMVAGFIRKPFQIEDVMKMIEQVI